MRTLQQFIDEGMSRLGLDSYNRLSQALGYKSSGYLSQVYAGAKGLREDREAQWIRTLKIPSDQAAEFRDAAALSRANQKSDIRDDYAELQKKTVALEARTARLDAALHELVGFIRGQRIKLPKELLERIKASLDD